MKTKPPEAIPTAFPTCGEIFDYLVAALDLHEWADAFNESSTKRREPLEIKALSDKLRDWANEADGCVPSRDDFENFIHDQIQTLPQADSLDFILRSLWERVLDEHARAVRENAKILSREGTRAWYARWRATSTLYFLWALQKLLRRLAQSKGPMLDARLDDLLTKAWPDVAQIGTLVKHPMHLTCYHHYAKIRAEHTSSVDAKTVAAWNSGEDRPSCDALGRHFSQFPDKLGLLLNFAFAGLLEALANTLKAWIKPKDWPDCRRLLLCQAQCVCSLDEPVAKALMRTPHMGLHDYMRLLSACFENYFKFLTALRQNPVDSFDLRVARFRVFEEYERWIADLPMPFGFIEFGEHLHKLWQETSLKAPSLKQSEADAELAKLRGEHPAWCDPLAGPLLAIEARLALCHEPPTQESLQRALNLYQKAFSASCYRAGLYTALIAREALGLAAMLHRRETGEGAIKPWIKKVLAWWDLLGLGTEFDHEQPDQRIELAESRFTDRLHDDLRARLRSALPQLGLCHWNIGGLFAFSEPGAVEQLQATPVDRRQKKPMATTIVGRDQTALMEAIDRGQLPLARELVRKGADLNFVNSTGDTCVTKAFAAKDYELVLEILRRDNEPICRETLLRETLKKRHSALERALRLGKIKIIRELALWKQGRGDIIDFSHQRVHGGVTPLYYLVETLAVCRMSPEQYVIYVGSVSPVSDESQFMQEFIMKDNDRREILKQVRALELKEENPDGLIECIGYLISELEVELEARNTQENTAFTLAVECGMHDVAAMLLAAGANVNHSFRGGCTALMRAILNDNYQMARLLLEYHADYRHFVHALGRPIYTMEMSERMRQIIPHP